MASKTVSFRLPENIVQAIEAHAKATGKNKTTLIVEVLTQAYGLAPSPQQRQITPTMLQQQLDDLKQQVTNLKIGKSYVSSREGLNGDAEPLVARIQAQIQVFDQIFSAVPDPIFVCDRQGQIVYMNRVGARLLGMERSKAVGENFQQLNLPPPVIERLRLQLELTLMYGKASRGEFELPMLSQPRRYEYCLNPILESDSSISGFVVIARDMTQYKETELALRDAEAQYRHLFELANDLRFIINASTYEILEVNSQASKRLGYPRKEIFRQSFFEISSPAAAAHYKAAIVTELEKTGSGIFEHTLRHKNGQEIRVEISSRLIEFRDQLVFECSARDLIKD
ncbi:MAG: PAS domain S-box protein [Leptolyngbyaceae cyanobacterium MO_188.B28]|nr:PAS domain S-box protein [Leptolyngbyaceae cyanobacterium MO_188.B28]